MSTTPTGPAATNATELDQLKAQVATLHAEMADLKRFLHVSKPDADEPGQPSLIINCSSILLDHHERPGKHQALFSAGEDGPCLSLWGSDDKARLVLEVKKQETVCQLFGKDLKEAAELRADEASGRGQIAVFDTGKPRAVMKAMETGGSLSAVHDDGTTRACMISSEFNGGEFMAVTPDRQVGVKITGATPDGGAIVVNRHNGKPAAILATTPLGGAMIIHDAKGNLIASLPAIPPAEPDGD